MADLANGDTKTPSKKGSADGRRSTRGPSGSKGARSESPTKKTPARKIATPRKRKTTRGKSAEPEALLNGETPASPGKENVKVEVANEKLPSPDGGDVEERTKVSIEMPTGHPDLPLPENAEGMLEKAREMVAEAEKVSARPTSPKAKRKAGEMDDAGEGSSQPAVKKAKKVELELRKERIKRRALTGIAASLAIGYVGSFIQT